jgi:hypothetical protein
MLITRFLPLLFVFNATVCSTAAASTAPATPEPDTARYTILAQGKLAGRQVVTQLPGRRMKVEFTYRDNGRGPDLFEDITIDGAGLLASFVATGKSTYGAPIDENFSVKAGKATWKSKADRGERTGAGGAIYVPIENSFETIAITARALLRAPGNKLPALPNGRLAIEKITDASVASKTGGGMVSLYAITGFGIEPSYLWLWADAPAGNRLFAVVMPSFSLVEAGWEDNCDALLKLQIEADSRRLKQLAGRLAHRSDVPVVFRNVRWFDAEAGVMKGPSDVHVFRGRIAAILPANSPLRDAATLIDGSGKTLLPGLADLHGHTSAWDAVLQIAGGITTLRDMGGDNNFLNSLQTRIDAGESIGPHLELTGFIEGDSPFFASGGFTIKGVEDAKLAIDWYAQHGYRQIKLYNSIRPEWVQPIAAYAHARGIRVSGHIPAFMRAEEAVRAGFDEIQHINQVVLNFLTKKDDDTRTLLRFYLVGDNANQIDLESAAVKDFIKLLVDRNTAIDPTLTAFEAMFLQRQGAPNPSFRTVAPNLPPAISRSWLTNSMDVTDKNAEPFRQSFGKLLAFVKLMYDAGVPLIAGSDDIAGFTLHRELELYVMAGLTPAQALQIATWNGARYSYRLARSGSITVGKDADLILVNGDPVANISDVRKASLTMKSGVIFFPAEVYEALGVKAFTGKPVMTAQPAPAGP